MKESAGCCKGITKACNGDVCSSGISSFRKLQGECSLSGNEGNGNAPNIGLIIEWLDE